MTAVIGVDPGANGALCYLSADRMDVVDMPFAAGIDPYELARILIAWGPVDRVAVEHVHSYPGQGVASSFTFGEGFGILRGVLAVLERPAVFVSPKKWVTDLRLPKGDRSPAGKAAAKAARRRRAMERWPAHAHLFSRVRDDGRADAALLALWCHEQLVGV